MSRIERISIETVDGRRIDLAGDRAKILHALLSGRDKGVTLADARAQGLDLEALQFELRRDLRLGIERNFGGHFLAEPLAIIEVVGMAPMSREVAVFWSNRLARARKAFEVALAKQKPTPAPAVIIQTPSGERTIHGAAALALAEFDCEHPSRVLSPEVAAQLADLVEKSPWCGVGHRLFHLRPGVEIVERRHCETTRRLVRANA